MTGHVIRLVLMLAAFAVGMSTTALAAGNGLDGPDWRADPPTLYGRHKWVCQAASCGSNAAVAYEPQLFNAVYTLLDYESQWKKRAKNPKGVPQAITKRGLFRLIQSYDETDGDLRHYTIIMRHREPNGTIDYVAAGYIARGLQAYELLSNALTSETAEANLKLLAEQVASKFATK
jgi:hypothetical protein